MILFVSPWKQNEYFKTIWIKQTKTKQNKTKKNKNKKLLCLSEFTYSLFGALVATAGQKSGETPGGVHFEPWHLQRKG